jgi:peptidoglycan/LPS O-acetylase OafA/YrhL
MRLGYSRALDGVRGIAITLVVAFHAFGWPGGGTLGVDLFFVLSGFLITTLLLEEQAAKNTIALRAFYARRARRLLPALFVMLTPFLLLALGSAATGSFQTPVFVGLGAAMTYTSNIVVAVHPSAVPAGLIHLWSLAAEEQFYILWPLLLLVLLRLGGVRLAVRSLAALLVIAVLYRLQLVWRGAAVDRLYYGPDTHADSLLVGCMFGCYFVRGRLPSWLIASARAKNGVGTIALLLVGAAAVLIGGLPAETAYKALLVPTAFAVAAGVLVVCAVLGDSPFALVLGLPPLVSLGRISYSLYLWHLPLLVAFAGLHREFGLRTVAAVTIAVAAAACSRKFIELRFLRRRVAPLRDTLNAAPAAAAV